VGLRDGRKKRFLCFPLFRVEKNMRIKGGERGRKGGGGEVA